MWWCVVFNVVVVGLCCWIFHLSDGMKSFHLIFFSYLLLYTDECVIMFMFMYACKSVFRVILSFLRDDCLFLWLKITKNKNDSIQVFVCLFASFLLTNLVSAKPKGFQFQFFTIFLHFLLRFNIQFETNFTTMFVFNLFKIVQQIQYFFCDLPIILRLLL